MKKLIKFLVKEKVYFLFFCSLLLLVRFSPILFQHKTLVFGDNYSLMVPGKIYLADWLRRGILPLWNPQILSGLPIISDINQSALYFTTLFFILFKPAVALNVSILIHVFLAMWGAYLLVKTWLKDKKMALLAAGLWGLSTNVSVSINNLSTIQSVVWLPWLAYWGLKLHQNKKYVWIYAFFVLVQFLAGYPQHVIYAIIFSVLLSAIKHWKQMSFKQWFLPWFFAGVASVLVSAVAWLPFLEMLLDSTRTQQSLAQAQAGSLNPSLLIKIFLPYFFDKQSWGVKWGPAWNGEASSLFYLGNFSLLAMTMTLFSKKLRQKKDWLFLFFTLGTIIFALGSYLPGFELIQKVVPLFKFGRYPSMVLLLTNLALILWTCSSLKRLKLNKKVFQFLLFSSGLIFLLSALAYILLLPNFTQVWHFIDASLKQGLSASVFHTVERDYLIFKMIDLNLITASLFFILALLAFYYQKKMLLVLIICFDLLVHTQGMFFFAPSEIYDYQNMDLFKTQLQDPQYRSLTRNSNQAYTDYGTYWEAMVVRQPFSDSFIDQEELTNYGDLIHLRDGYTPNWNIVHQLPMVHGYTTLLPKDYAAIWAKSDETRINFVDYIDSDNPNLQAWSVKYYLVDRFFEIKEEINYPLLAKNEVFEIYQLPDTLARFRYANQAPVELRNFSENPNQISFEFTNDTNQQYLIIADRYDRNWRAWVNDQPVEVENYQGMRQVKIEVGENSVMMKFVPTMFYLGAAISALSLAVLWFLSRKNNF